MNNTTELVSDENISKYMKSVEQGNAKAQYHLGNCYYSGQGMEQSYEKAFYWYKKAAKQGYRRAEYNLGVCYARGEGVEKSEKKAFYWHKKAAEQGLAEAQLNLAKCYFFLRRGRNVILSNQLLATKSL